MVDVPTVRHVCAGVCWVHLPRLHPRVCTVRLLYRLRVHLRRQLLPTLRLISALPTRLTGFIAFYAAPTTCPLTLQYLQTILIVCQIDFCRLKISDFCSDVNKTRLRTLRARQRVNYLKTVLRERQCLQTFNVTGLFDYQSLFERNIVKRKKGGKFG